MSVCSPEWQCFSSFYQSYCISSCSRTMCVCLCVRASLFCMWAYYYSPCVAPAIRLITFQSPLYVSLTHTSFLFIQCTTSSFLTLQSALPLSLFTPLHIIFSNSLNPFFCPPYNFCLTYLTLSFSWFFCLRVISHPLSLKMCFWGLERQSGCTHIIRKFKSLTEVCICITIIWITV